MLCLCMQAHHAFVKQKTISFAGRGVLFPYPHGFLSTQVSKQKAHCTLAALLGIPYNASKVEQTQVPKKNPRKPKDNSLLGWDNRAGKAIHFRDGDFEACSLHAHCHCSHHLINLAGSRNSFICSLWKTCPSR